MALPTESVVPTVVAPLTIPVPEFNMQIGTASYLQDVSVNNVNPVAYLELTINQMESLFTVDTTKVDGPSEKFNSSAFPTGCASKNLGSITDILTGSYFDNYLLQKCVGSSGIGETGNTVTTTVTHPEGPCLLTGFIRTDNTNTTIQTLSDQVEAGKISKQNIIEDEMLYLSKYTFGDPCGLLYFSTAENKNIMANELFTLGVLAKKQLYSTILADIANSEASAVTGDTAPGQTIASRIRSSIIQNRSVSDTDKMGFVVDDALQFNVRIASSPTQINNFTFSNASSDSTAVVGAQTYLFSIKVVSDVTTHAPIRVQDAKGNKIYNTLAYNGETAPLGDFIDESKTSYSTSGSALGAVYSSV